MKTWTSISLIGVIAAASIPIARADILIGASGPMTGALIDMDQNVAGTYE